MDIFLTSNKGHRIDSKIDSGCTTNGSNQQPHWNILKPHLLKNGRCGSTIWYMSLLVLRARSQGMRVHVCLATYSSLAEFCMSSSSIIM